QDQTAEREGSPGDPRPARAAAGRRDGGTEQERRTDERRGEGGIRLQHLEGAAIDVAARRERPRGGEEGENTPDGGERACEPGRAGSAGGEADTEQGDADERPAPEGDEVVAARRERRIDVEEG